jgi:hypothetical protein
VRAIVYFRARKILQTYLNRHRRSYETVQEAFFAAQRRQEGSEAPRGINQATEEPDGPLETMLIILPPGEYEMRITSPTKQVFLEGYVPRRTSAVVADHPENEPDRGEKPTIIGQISPNLGGSLSNLKLSNKGECIIIASDGAMRVENCEFTDGTVYCQDDAKFEIANCDFEGVRYVTTAPR